MDLASIVQRLASRSVAPAAQSVVPQAAVAVLLREGRDGAEILLIRRAERSGDPWSGHMAFPGGRHEKWDASLLCTAQRETREEIGLDLATTGTLLATLPDVHTHQTGLAVRPYVFSLCDWQQIALSDEVVEVVWAPVAPWLRGEATGTFAYPAGGGESTMQLPCFLIEKRVVWGLTYRMLELLFEALR